MHKIPLIKPYVTDEVKQKVNAVLDSGYLTEGPVTRELESQVRAYLGCRHAIAVCNCTVGLEIALRAVGIGPGDEVIVPDYTYPATASAVAIVGATPVIVDVEPDTMLIDLAAAESAVTPRTRAIMPVSIFGNPLDYERLAEFKRRHKLLVIEDAACSIGAEYKGRKVGSLADISVFSLHPRKFITTGEGGLITTDHDEWAAWMDSYKHFGMSASPTREGTVFARIGTNYKLSNVQAAIGVVQMKHIDELLAARRACARIYRRLLAGCPQIRFPSTPEGGIHSYQSYCVFVPGRDQIMQSMRAQGVEVQIGTYALHLQPAYQDDSVCRLQMPLDGSRTAFDTCLALPLHHELTEDEQQFVVTTLLAELRSSERQLRKSA